MEESTVHESGRAFQEGALNNNPTEIPPRPARPPQPIWENFPDELTALPRWLLWRYERVKKDWTKVPYQPDGSPASSTDPATWAAFEYIQTAYHTSGRFDGVGIALNDDGIVGFDFDAVKDKAKKIIRHIVKDGAIIDPIVADHVKLLNTYSEFSPSGEGVRGFAYGKLPAEGRKLGNIECYEGGRYLTVTGNIIPGTPTTIKSRQAEIDAVHAAVFAERRAKRERSHQHARPAAGSVNLDDAALLDKARKAKNGARFAALYDHGDWQGQGFSSQSEADLALCGMLAFWTGGDAGRIDTLFRASGLMRDKWSDRDDYRASTIEKAMNQGAFYDPQAKRSAAKLKVIQLKPRETTGKGKAEPGAPEPYSNDHLALILAMAKGADLRYVAPWNKWFEWLGAHWQEERPSRYSTRPGWSVGTRPRRLWTTPSWRETSRRRRPWRPSQACLGLTDESPRGPNSGTWTPIYSTR